MDETIQSETLADLRQQVQHLQDRLAESEETLRAIRGGEVDALVVSGPDGDQVFTLTNADAPYRVIVQEMSEGAVTLTPDGTILYANSQFSALTATPLEHLLGSSVLDSVNPADRPDFDALLEAAASGQSRGELRLRGSGQNIVPVFLSFNRLELEGSTAVCLVVTDLTGQKRSEEIVASEQLARLILDEAAEAIVMIDAEGTVFRASQAAHRLAGVNPLLKPLDAVYPLTSPSASADTGSRALLNQRELLEAARSGRLVRGLQAQFQRADGQTFDLVVGLGALWSHNREFLGAVATLTDITDQRRAQEAVRETEAARALAKGLLQGQEEERRRLARDLHDGLNQVLASLAIRIGLVLESDSSSPPVMRKELAHLRERIEEVSDEVRRMSHELHSSVLEHLGLCAALQSLCAEFKEQWGISVRFHGHDGPAKLSPEVATCLYRITQEGLSNIAKHAQARDATVKLEGKRDEIVLEISDLGVGFDPTQTMREKGLGLASIKERVRAFSGHFALHSKPSQGTALTISIPRARPVGASSATATGT